MGWGNCGGLSSGRSNQRVSVERQRYIWRMPDNAEIRRNACLSSGGENRTTHARVPCRIRSAGHFRISCRGRNVREMKRARRGALVGEYRRPSMPLDVVAIQSAISAAVVPASWGYTAERTSSGDLQVRNRPRSLAECVLSVYRSDTGGTALHRARPMSCRRARSRFGQSVSADQHSLLRASTADTA
uniref:Uncharacterized protein n=1 Tax=Rhodococcus sp. NS1 TaxID=402236 RepID=A0A097SQK1_9NOCA|nr:hypothetical protein LRS1606.356 [Rhodococcus sp. NS1]